MKSPLRLGKNSNDNVLKSCLPCQLFNLKPSGNNITSTIQAIIAVIHKIKADITGIFVLFLAALFFKLDTFLRLNYRKKPLRSLVS